MTMEELLRERKRIDDEIRKLKAGCPVENGLAKYDVEHYPTDLPDRHYIAVLTNKRERPRWMSIVSGGGKKEVAEQIPDIVRDLNALYYKLTKQTEM